MKTQRYRLLTTLIVSALHPNEPHPTGTEWAPVNVIDIQEADSLVLSGYAEKSEGKGSAPLASTVIERQDAARKAKEAADRGETVDDDAGSNLNETDQVLTLILEGSVDQVKAELDGLTGEQLQRLSELEDGADGKQRKGVADAITAAIEALGE
jgi:hypothetical protein